MNSINKEYSQAEFKKRRLPSYIKIAVIFALLLITCSILLPGFKDNKAEARPGDELVKRIAETENTEGIKHIAGRIKPGMSYYSIMESHHIAYDSAVEFYAKLNEVGYKTLMAGDSYSMAIDEFGNLTKFGIRNSLRTWFLSEKGENGVNGRKREPNFIVEEKRVAGVLKSSLYESIQALDENVELAMIFSDIFAWDINFFCDPQRGDSFQIVVEKLYDREEFVKYGRILAGSYNGKLVSSKAYLFSFGNQESYYDEKGNSVQKMFLKAPLRYSRISSGFSMRRYHPVLHIYRKHPAVDYAAPKGTPVYAAAGGTVIYAKTCGGYGNCIAIKHGKGYKTYYGHLHGYARGIGRGRKVAQGQCIGYVGSTGLSTGPHLDYRFEQNGRYVNPLKIKSPTNKSVHPEFRTAFNEVMNKLEAQLMGLPQMTIAGK